MATPLSPSLPSSSATTSPLALPHPSPTSQSKRPGDETGSPPAIKRTRTGMNIDQECVRDGEGDGEGAGVGEGEGEGEGEGGGEDEDNDQSVSPENLDKHEIAGTNQTTRPTGESPMGEAKDKQNVTGKNGEEKMTDDGEENMIEDDGDEQNEQNQQNQQNGQNAIGQQKSTDHDEVIELKQELNDTDIPMDDVRETSATGTQVEEGPLHAPDPEVPWEPTPHAKERQATAACPSGELKNLLPRSDGEIIYRTHDQHGFRYIFRPSTEWAWSSMLCPDGSWCYSYGALFPIGYQLSSNILGRPWVCPIRDCRTAWIKASDMGHHFSHAHHCCLLNDNLDGTFTIVGTYPFTGIPNNFQDRIKNEPYVVSLKRTGSSHSVPDIPIAPPRLPANHKPKDGKPSHEPSKGSQEPDKTPVLGRAQDDWKSRETSKSADPTNPTPEEARDAHSLSSYASSFVGDIESNASPYVLELLKLPRVREVEWNKATEIPFEPAEEADAAALLVYLAGVEAPRPCSKCLLRLGPFSGCVVLTMKISLHIGPPVDCCANCLYGGGRDRCSIRLWGQLPNTSKPSPATVPRTPPGQAYPEGACQAKATEPARRADRNVEVVAWTAATQPLVIAQPAAIPQPALASGFGTLIPSGIMPARAPPPPPPPPHRMQPGSPSLQTSRDGKFSELEDWEIAQARNGVDPSKKYVALSGAYLATGQVISVAPNVLVRTITLKPGMVMDKFTCPWNATVMFLVISGKVQVKYADENGDFSIGNHGMFRVDVGRVCNIMNKCYGDAILHLIQCPAG